jgi:predicted RNase H-like HicB family nuclease
VLQFLPSRVEFLNMKREVTAIMEAPPEAGFWAVCPEIPGANGQGDFVEGTSTSRRKAIQLILEDRLDNGRRGLSFDAIQPVVLLGR